MPRERGAVLRARQSTRNRRESATAGGGLEPIQELPLASPPIGRHREGATLMLPSILKLVLVLCLAGDDSTVDKVVLRTGGIVEGTIVAEDAKSVAIEVSSGGRIEVPMSAVKSITRATERPASAPASKPAPLAPIAPRTS